MALVSPIYHRIDGKRVQRLIPLPTEVQEARDEQLAAVRDADLSRRNDAAFGKPVKPKPSPIDLRAERMTAKTPAQLGAMVAARATLPVFPREDDEDGGMFSTGKCPKVGCKVVGLHGHRR